MEYLVHWMLLVVCGIITMGVVAVIFIRRTSNIDLKIKGLGLEVSFAAKKSRTRGVNGDD